MSTASTSGGGAGSDPAETLFIISSKTFTTLGPIIYQRAYRAGLAPAGLNGEASPPPHSSPSRIQRAEVAKFGIDTANMFGFGIGSAGATRWIWRSGCRPCWPSDRHFRAMLVALRDGRAFPHRAVRAQPAVLMGPRHLVQRFFAQTVAVLPYEQYLKRFPAYLQQLTRRATAHVTGRRGRRPRHRPIYWGEPGTNGQHSFYQMIHQGTRLMPYFIAFAHTLNPLGRHHDILLANVRLTEALAFGKAAKEVKAEGTPDWLVPHRLFEGTVRRTPSCWTS